VHPVNDVDVFPVYCMIPPDPVNRYPLEGKYEVVGTSITDATDPVEKGTVIGF